MALPVDRRTSSRNYVDSTGCRSSWRKEGGVTCCSPAQRVANKNVCACIINDEVGLWHFLCCCCQCPVQVLQILIITHTSTQLNLSSIRWRRGCGSSGGGRGGAGRRKRGSGSRTKEDQGVLHCSATSTENALLTLTSINTAACHTCCVVRVLQVWQVVANAWG